MVMASITIPLLCKGPTKDAEDTPGALFLPCHTLCIYVFPYKVLILFCVVHFTPLLALALTF
jgi:hypothetical protein